MKKINIVVYMIIVFCCIPNIKFSVNKPSITPIDNTNELADYLLEENDDGLKIENVRLNGKTEQLGIFKNAANGNITGFNNLDEGIVFSTGYSNQDIFTKSDTFLSQSFNADGWTYGQPVEGKTFDYSCIYFDVTSNTDSVAFRYVFASEEFDQPPKFNDFMYMGYKDADEAGARFKSASLNPIYNGTTIEEDSEKMEISINKLRNTKYHYDNIKGKNIAFLGYTPLLTCQAKVMPGKKYTFVIAITDMGDPIYDSAIFLKAHSLTSKEPPPSEENPNPSTRELLEIKEEISAVKITTQLGNVLNSVDIKYNNKGEPYITNDSERATLLVGDNNSLQKAIDNLILSIDQNALYGAKLEIEYNIKMKNNGTERLTINSITEKKDKKLNFGKNFSLITENAKNSDNGWKLQENGTVKLQSGENIEPDQEINKKIVLTRNLANIDEDYEPYSNSAIVNFSYSLEHGYNEFEKSNKDSTVSKAGNITLLTPTGKNNTIDILQFCYVEFIIILIVLYIYIKYNY